MNTESLNKLLDSYNIPEDDIHSTDLAMKKTLAVLYKQLNLEIKSIHYYNKPDSHLIIYVFDNYIGDTHLISISENNKGSVIQLHEHYSSYLSYDEFKRLKDICTFITYLIELVSSDWKLWKELGH